MMKNLDGWKPHYSKKRLEMSDAYLSLKKENDKKNLESTLKKSSIVRNKRKKHNLYKILKYRFDWN